MPLEFETGGMEIPNRWSDAARAASLAVRQALSAKRRAERKTGEKKERDAVTRERRAEAYRERYGRDPDSDAEWAEAAVLDRDRKLGRGLGLRNRSPEDNRGMDANEREAAAGEQGATGAGLANAWSEQSRMASLAVRRAKAQMRGGTLQPQPPAGRLRPGEPRPAPPDPDEGRVWAGGTPWFDEKTGRYVGRPQLPGPGRPNRPWMPRPGAPVPQPGTPGGGVPWMPGHHKLAAKRAAMGGRQ